MRNLIRPVIAFALLLCSGLLLAQTPPTSSKPKSHLPPIAPQEQYIPYWTLENGWHTELEIRSNHGTLEITVTPVLRFSSGHELPLAPVILKPNQIRSVDIHEELTRNKPEIIGKPDSFGSVVLRFNSHNTANIYGASMVGLMGSPVAYHFDAIGKDKGFAAGDYEGLWWLPKETTSAFLILTNSSDEPVHPELSWFVAEGNGKEKLQPLGPRQTRRIDIREATRRLKLTGEFGGLRLSVTNGAGSLQLAHIVYDVVAAFSALIRVHPHDPNGRVGTKTIRAPMVSLTNPDPALAFPAGTTLQSRVFLRNATAQPMPVTVNLSWKRDADTGMTGIPIETLKPEETRLLDLSALQASGQIPRDANWAGVHLTYQGRLGDLVATARSFSENLRYGAQSPFRAAMTGQWRGGMWKVDDTRNSLITAGNGGKEPLTVAITFMSKDGTFRYDLPHRVLQPGEQAWVDVAKLIRTQIPDKDGKVFPLTMTSGSYQMEDVKHPPVGYLFEGKLILDKKFGHVGYGCMQCCGFSNSFQTLDPLGMPLAATNQQRAKTINSCNNGEEDFTNYSYGWYSTNTAVATVTSNGIAEAVSEGSAEIFGFFDANSFFIMSDPCPADQQSTYATVTVLASVVITSADVRQDRISVTLGSTTSGTLAIEAVYAGGSSVYLTTGTRSAGSFNESFNIPNLPYGEYVSLRATYTVNGLAAQHTLSYGMFVLGTYRHSQYNSPSESACVGNAASAYLLQSPSACFTSFVSGSLKSDFYSQVNINGSGHSVNYADIKSLAASSCVDATQGRPGDATGGANGNSFVKVTAISGACNIAMTNNVVAKCSSDGRLQCGDQVYIHGVGTKTVGDHCPACCNAQGAAQLDNYTVTNQSCVPGSINDLGNFKTIKVSQ